MKPFQSVCIALSLLFANAAIAGTSSYSNVATATSPSTGSSGTNTSGTISFTIQSLGTAQSNAGVFSGIPFPAHILSDPNQIDLVINGQSVPRQVQSLSTYSDGSQRVVLLGFRVTLTAGQTISAQIRYGQGTGTAIGTALTWARNLNVLALCPPKWYGDSGVFSLPFLASANNTINPSFETGMVNDFLTTGNPPDASTDVAIVDRSYYDRIHALYMVLLRNGGPTVVWQRIANEVSAYRDSDIEQSGSCQGRYNPMLSTGPYASGCSDSYMPYGHPMTDAGIRHTYAVGLLEDYYLSGDPRSLTVAGWIGARLLDTHAWRTSPSQANIRGWNAWINWGGNPGENVDIREAGWALINLCELYNATRNASYLTTANAIAKTMMDYQDAMAAKYPSQGGVSGQTGGWVQDVWNDSSETTCGPAIGSSFMSTIACQGLMRLYWITGDTRTRDSIVHAADWLTSTAYSSTDKAYDYLSLDRNACSSITYGTTPDLNGMFLQMLGFAWQITGSSTYMTQANALLSTSIWINGSKQFDENMQSSGQGLYLLQQARGAAKLTGN